MRKAIFLILIMLLIQSVFAQGIGTILQETENYARQYENGEINYLQFTVLTNALREKIEIFVGASPIPPLENVVPVAIVIAPAIVVLLFLYRRWTKIKSTETTTLEREKALEQINKLQHDYFTKKTVPKYFYDQKMKELKQKLNETENTDKK